MVFCGLHRRGAARKELSREWNGKNEKKQKIKKELPYDIYAVLSLHGGSCFFRFLSQWKTFVWDSDGVTQHFNALLYYRSWLREILRTVFVEHRLEIPLWDLKIGYGSDILTTLHYYAYGDPLNLLSVFVPKEAWMDEFYSFLILLRIYLAGLSFSFFWGACGRSWAYRYCGRRRDRCSHKYIKYAQIP